MTDRIEREMLLAASAEEVWDALTDPARLAGWLADEVVLDLRPGGDAWFRSGSLVRTGWIEDVAAPGTGAGGGGRLAFWWCQEDRPATRVELELERVDGERTRLRVVETRPLELLDLVGIPLARSGGAGLGPALVAVGG